MVAARAIDAAGIAALPEFAAIGPARELADAIRTAAASPGSDPAAYLDPGHVLSIAHGAPTSPGDIEAALEGDVDVLVAAEDELRLGTPAAHWQALRASGTYQVHPTRLS